MSNNISFTRGTTETFEVLLVDENGETVALEDLVGASAEFLLRVLPTDAVNAIRFTSTLNPTSLAFKTGESALLLSFIPSDTSAIALGAYFYQLQVTLATGDVLDVIPWSLFDLNLGGAAATPVAPFTNTTKIDHDYQLPGDLSYYSPGGSPIEGAQVRLYYKTDYEAGNLTAPVGITMTDAGGRWLNPILVLPGYSYIVRFEKPNEWGPNTQEIFA